MKSLIIYISIITILLSNDIKLFIIGDSTVYNSTHNEMGWGTAIKEFAKNKDNIFNLAREVQVPKAIKYALKSPAINLDIGKI